MAHVPHTSDTGWPPGPAGEARKPFNLQEALASEDEASDDQDS